MFIDEIESDYPFSFVYPLALALSSLWLFFDGRFSLKPVLFRLNIRVYGLGVVGLLIFHFKRKGYFLGLDLFTFFIFIFLIIVLLVSIVEVKNK